MPEILILILVGIGWVFVKIVEGVSSTQSSYKKQKELEEERAIKFKDRLIDRSKNLFERNKDIVERFEKRLDATSYRSYYIENETRDCINEICLAENEA